MAIDEADFQARLDRIKGHSSAIITEADVLLAALEGEEPSHPIVEPPLEIAVEPPSTQHAYLDPIWGGPIGSGGRKVVENAEWKGKEPNLAAKTDYVNPKFWNMNCGSRCYIGEDIEKDIRLFNPIFENITTPEHFIYVNHGWYEEKNEIRLVIFGGYSKGLKAKETWAEFKATKILIEDHVVEGSCSFGQYVRQRHGRQLVMVGGRSDRVIAARGWCHYIDVPGATGQLWSGTIPAKSKDWIPQKEKGQGDYQCSELCYLSERVKKAVVGQESTKKDDCPAKNNIVHPDVRDVDMKNEDGTKREAIGGWKELWRKAGLL